MRIIRRRQTKRASIGERKSWFAYYVVKQPVGKVFISYRHEDQEPAGRICQALEARDISCWIAFRDIPIGSDWPSEIMDALQNSQFFVVVLSSHSVNEEQISREVRIASDQLKLPVFPIRIENVQPPKKLSYFLGEIQWLDAFDGKFDEAMNKLACRIQGIPAAIQPSAAAAAATVAEPQPQPRPMPAPPSPVPTPPATPQMPPLNVLICGRWNVVSPVSQSQLAIYPNGTLEGQLVSQFGTSYFNANWQITPAGLFTFMGQIKTGWDVRPLFFSITFTQVTPGCLTGIGSDGIQSAWYRLG